MPARLKSSRMYKLAAQEEDSNATVLAAREDNPCRLRAAFRRSGRAAEAEEEIVIRLDVGAAAGASM